ncbi:MFS transporter [Sphingomonas abietis]|uniref:MFS transporter n=1 Tax=Sphingomonas abietis TaxID=3012344 RepID=A0ABY7NNM0_9SPHN|nr:MFS transporter [Sphingomonas abietis]WBO21509.1 MFS transporter [Sphingomonas abietis]
MNPPDDRVADRLFCLLLGVYGGGGLLNAIVNLLVPRLQITLGLDYAQALSVHLAYYSSYLLFALPITLWSIRIGAMRAITAGLAIMASGCLLFAVAQGQRDFAFVLTTLLVMSAGVTFLQISGNAVTTAFGGSVRMAPRFTLLQAFNSLGTVIGPLIGAWFLLGRAAAAAPVQPFLIGAVALLLLAAAFWAHRDLLPRPRSSPLLWSGLGALVRRGRMQAAMGAIFAYVGAEVTIATLAVDYLMRPDTLGQSPLAAGRLVSLYWAGAMAGRFAGSYALRRIGIRHLLCAACIGAASLLVIAMTARGSVGGVALLAIGLCHSVMFPLIFTLALPAEDKDAALASMLLCMAVVGGAVIPVVTGLLADRIGLVPSLVVPGLCYGVIFAFGRATTPRVPGAA